MCNLIEIFILGDIVIACKRQHKITINKMLSVLFLSKKKEKFLACQF